MRDLASTDDDVAAERAREQLASLARRAGYAEAMRPSASGSRAGRLIASGVALGFAGLAVASASQVEAWWLRAVLVGLFIVLAMVSGLAVLGFAAAPPPVALGAVIVGKGRQEHNAMLHLLSEDGARREVIVLDDLHEVLRVGDVGVAHLSHATPPVVTAFHRL